MAVTTLIRHGTETGYRAEVKTGTPCSRCTNAHRVYATQFRPKGRREGLKYDTNAVIDHLYKNRGKGNLSGVVRSETPRAPASVPAEDSYTVTTEPKEPEPKQSLGDQLADRIRAMTMGAPEQNPYVEENDTGYVHAIDDLDAPGSEWEPAPDSEYVITAAGLKKIEQNLGTYLSIVGMTAEMIDPYCGPILAENFDNIVGRWSKVIAHYPKAAELFMDGKGGVIFTWIGALQATWPVLYAIYQHHLAKTIMVAPNGRIYNKREMPNPNGQMSDPLQPEFQYSAT